MFDRLPKRWKTHDETTGHALAWLADMVPAPIALVTSDEESPRCNAALRRLLSDESESDRRELTDAIELLADQMRLPPIGDGGHWPIDERELRVRTSGRGYLMEPVFAPFDHELRGLIRLHRSRT